MYNSSLRLFKNSITSYTNFDMYDGSTNTGTTYQYDRKRNLWHVQKYTIINNERIPYIKI